MSDAKGDELPDVVYKYRDWQDQYHKRILTHKELFFASPLDCHEYHELKLSYDLASVTPEDLYNHYLRIYGSSEEAKDAAKKFVESNIFYTENFKLKKEQEYRKSLNEFISIFSVSSQYHNPHLWDSFAKYKTGICVGIYTNKLISDPRMAGMYGKVNYYSPEKIPLVKAFHNGPHDTISDIHSIIYTLPVIFEDEKEFRFSKSELQENRIIVDKSYIKEIILGENIKMEDREEIINLCKTDLTNVKLYDGRFTKDCNDFLLKTEISF
jgi:hypothetical protein